MKLLRKEYGRDIITGNKVLLQIDKESDGHESHCLTYWIKFELRTLYSCTCGQKKVYQDNYSKLR